MACLCAPTSHEGSFRCRLHRAPNPIINPSMHVIKAVNPCINSSNSTCNQIRGIPYSATVPETSASTAPMDPLVNENGRLFSHFPQVAADRQYGTRCIQSSLPSETFAGSSVSSSSPKSLSYRQPRSIRSSSSPSSLYISSLSSRASASSSSPSPSLPFSGTRPPPAKRPSLSSSSLPKCLYRTSSLLIRPTSTWGGSPAPSNNFAPSSSHAAAMAIMKRHLLHSKRTHNRNTLSPTNSASKIGPSRLSRMAVACADELPILKEENSISGSHHHATSGPDTSISSAFVDTSMPGGLPTVGTTHINVAQIGLKMRSAAYKFKQIESSCRVVGSNKGSLIMPTVY